MEKETGLFWLARTSAQKFSAFGLADSFVAIKWSQVDLD